jgi:hypothetical protein
MLSLKTGSFRLALMMIDWKRKAQAAELKDGGTV